MAEDPSSASGTASSGADLALELRGITKRFGSFTANDRIDFDLRQGEVHALLGENGAGKSTLMNVLYGLYKPDEGEIFVRGRPDAITSSADAIRLGIGMVHQHFMLIPVMTVVENIVLGAEPTEYLQLDLRTARERVRELSSSYGLVVDPDAVIEEIGVGQQQRVEILKALYRHARVLILDEPTAVLTPQEVDELFAVLRTLVAGGTSIILITHKLHEVLEVADRITVLRRGKKVATIDREGASERSLAELMVGREVLLDVEKGPPHPSGRVLSVQDLWVRDDRGLDAVRGLSMEVKAGEIVGIAGVDGNGQSELIQALAGMRAVHQGRIDLNGSDVTHATPRQATNAGVGHIPEDRQRHGLILDFTLAENTALHDYYEPPISSHHWLNREAMVLRADEWIKLYDVRGGGPQTLARALSGGNQQKVVLAREIQSNPRLLIAAQPTRGLDVGAIEYVHRRLIEQRDAGCAVLLVSFELDEVLDLADRILVMYGGQVVLERLSAETDERELGVAMTGGKVPA
ncbi:MAG TPA: ABC transporter ATP-binding protein [Gaiellales bacterium]|jgi:simple sugar transport system ATP-binding protein|nr:ABC transporter ATP-binding protein [Gaiellales bacterium]